MSSIKDFFQDVNPQFQSHLKLATTLTFVEENLYSHVCSRNDMPTILEFAYPFVPTVPKAVNRQWLCVLHLGTLVL